MVRYIRQGAALAALASLLAACAPAPPSLTSLEVQESPGVVTRDRVLAIAVKNEPRSIAAVSPSGGGVAPSFTVRPFNAYMELVDDRGVGRPYLAEALPQLNTDSWQVFPDGRMETRYRLKTGLTWHDGAPLGADDFVFAWQVYIVPDLGLAGSAPLTQIEEVLAPNARSVVIRWRRAYPGAGILQIGTTNPGLPPLPRHLLEKSFREGSSEALMIHPYWTQDFVGLGPYRLERWELGSFIEAAAFDGHALGKPKVDQIKLVFFADANTALASMRAGAVQMATDNALTWQQGLELKQEWAATNAGTLLRTAGAWRSIATQLRPDVANPRAILDLRVRKALMQALDRQAVNEGVWAREGLMTDTFIASTVEYFPMIDAAIMKYPFDLRASERFMNEAGFTKGPEGFFTSSTDGRFTPELKSLAGGDNDTERTIVAHGWRQAGFDVQEAALPAALGQDGQSRAIFPTMYSYSQNAAEANLVSAFTSASIPKAENRWIGDNRPGWANAEYDRIVDAFNATLDPNERVQQRVQIARLVSEELPSLPMYFQLTPGPFLSSLFRGPVPVTPAVTSGALSWNIHEWEWIR
ncbi:MAG: hypothetical protein HW416_1429 [Chloroflexi bacterium]|nr:hypothetical protein [Chloroflexota bacterium]